METIVIKDKGYFRKLGVGISVTSGGTLVALVFNNNRYNLYGYLFGLGVGLLTFMLTRFYSEIRISDEELIYSGRVLMVRKEKRIEFQSITKIVESVTGKGSGKIYTIFYLTKLQPKKLVIYEDEFPQLLIIVKTLSSKVPFLLEEAGSIPQNSRT